MAVRLPRAQHSWYSCPLSGVAKMELLFSEVHRSSVRDNRHKLQKGKFQLDMGVGEGNLKTRSGQTLGEIA